MCCQHQQNSSITLKAVNSEVFGVFCVLKHLPPRKCKKGTTVTDTVHSETTTFASVFRFRLTGIGRHLQRPDPFPGL